MAEVRLIKVDIIAKTDINPIDLISHAAFECYQAETPKIGKKINVRDRLFKVGHHTTLEHYFFTFNIEGISVGDISTGFHLVNPFYNSDQRSGRYCAEMFLNPDYKKIELYIRKHWPNLTDFYRRQIMDYIKKGVSVFHNNIEMASHITKKILKEERPFASDVYLDNIAPKIAQEQMRVFISTIFPTGFDFTVNLTTLSALHASAWTPSMKATVKQMVSKVIDIFPELSFLFDSQLQREKKWSFKVKNQKGLILDSPILELVSIDSEEGVVYPENKDMHPIDLLHYLPVYMNNSVCDIKTTIETSLMTMGQDQRHRTLRRGEPVFTGNFYLPAIPQACKLLSEAKNILNIWRSLEGNIPNSLFTVIAPYGAMVRYTKKGSFNAIAHEQAKRLCFCSSEEIYNLGRLLREAIEKKQKNSKLLGILEPPCYKTGKCAEGDKYCGRDIGLRINGDYFPKRKV